MNHYDLELCMKLCSHDHKLIESFRTLFWTPKTDTLYTELDDDYTGTKETYDLSHQWSLQFCQAQQSHPLELYCRLQTKQ